MTGNERIQAALSREGAREIPAVICYESIFIRDHWAELTGLPWWYADEPDVGRQQRWREEVQARIGQDWFVLPPCRPRAERERLSIIARRDGVVLRDARSGSEHRLDEPVVGGWPPGRTGAIAPTVDPPTTIEDVERLIPLPTERDARAIRASGEADLADALLRGPLGALHPVVHVSGPLWSCYDVWGFEHLMVAILEAPELVRRACDRFLAVGVCRVRRAAALGARSIWIEDCMTDMLDPGSFSRLNVPTVAALVREIHAQGLSAIHYFCGDPSGKWDALLALGADALSLEESKKGFAIDIEEVVDRVAGKMCVLGNLDAIGLLEHGSDAELEREIARQIRAGRRNGSRFIASIGSPVTPGTPLERVRRYLDTARRLGAG